MRRRWHAAVDLRRSAAAELLGHRAAAFSRRSDLGDADVLDAAVSDAPCAAFDLKQIALFAWLPFLAADLGCLFGGTFSHALQKRCGVQPDQRAALRLHGRRAHDARRRLRRLRREPICGDRAAQPCRFRAPDPVGHRDHHVLRSVQAQRSGHGRGHGGHVWQRRAADLFAADRRAGDDDRLHAVLRRPRVLDLIGAADPVDACREPHGQPRRQSSADCDAA